MAFLTKDNEGWMVILTPDNLVRMKRGDPFSQPDLKLTICYEDLPQNELMLKLGKNPRKYLQRGWKNQPGDYEEWKKVAQP